MDDEDVQIVDPRSEARPDQTQQNNDQVHTVSPTTVLADPDTTANKPDSDGDDV